jgi:hypothetical protein
MAKAEASVRKVERVVVEEVTDGVMLTLSNHEAEALAVVMRRIGGMASHSRRGFTDAIFHALVTAGVPFESDNDDLSGGLYFADLYEDDERLESLNAF